MQSVLRPYATAGMALVGGSVIAVAPMAPPLSDLPETRSVDVQLTAGGGVVDLFAPWLAQFNDASAGASALVNNFAMAPGVGLQQAIVNQVGYLQDIITDPQNIPDVLSQMGANLQSVATSFLLAGASSETIKTVTGLTLNGGHRTMLTFLPSFMTGVSPTMKELVVQGLNFASSPVTGVLMGLEGPFVAPGVSVLNSAEAIVNALSAGDPTAALQDVLAMPANAVGSVFNGSTLNLDALVPVLNPLMSQLGLLPSGTSLTSLDMAFPGLLSPGDVGNTYDYYDYAGNVIDKVPAVGGSLFNDIGLGILANIDGHSIPFDAPSAPAGTLAVLEGLSQAIGQELGDGWVFSGKKAGTSPVPPLSTLTFPQFSDVSANANSAAADAMASINAGDLANLPALVNSLPADVMNSLSSLASLPHEILVNTLLGLF